MGRNRSMACRAAVRNGTARPLVFEPLEFRTLLTAKLLSPSIPSIICQPIAVPAGEVQPDTSQAPAQILGAYGINNIQLGSVAGTGAGQTIAVIDAYNESTISSDLATFDSTYGLAAPPSFQVLNENGQGSLPSSNASWSIEEALDVEWAHAVAPAANIILFEANSGNLSDLLTAVQTAENYVGVSVVSMSWSAGDFGGESGLDSYFTTPPGHSSVTFVAASGDQGTLSYPATSPNVLGVGGTSLVTNGNSYSSETAWSGSGGGATVNESEPSYQQVVQSSGDRESPDVAFDAAPGSGVSIYVGGSWTAASGTSLSGPCWAGLIAITDQLRGTPLDGPSQTLPYLYQIDAADFHDITSGSNGHYSAGLGYDEVTGLGSPVAYQLVPDLALYPTGMVTNPATTTTIATSRIAPVYGQSVTLAATVGDGDLGVNPPAGTVTFAEGTTTLGTATLARGMAFYQTSPLTPGTYKITATYDGEGTTFTGSTSSTLSLVVAPAKLTITANNQTKVYGAALPALTASYSGLVNGDTPASLAVQPTLATTATASSDVSGNPYSITATGAADPDYTISYVAGTLTVTPAPLTITADNQSMVYGSGAAQLDGHATRASSMATHRPASQSSRRFPPRRRPPATFREARIPSRRPARPIRTTRSATWRGRSR